jgi:hypothetical protein
MCLSKAGINPLAAAGALKSRPVSGMDDTSLAGRRTAIAAQQGQ